MIQVSFNSLLVFKESWHRADFEPGARQKYVEAAELVKKMDKCLGSSWSIMGTLCFLDVDPREHRRVIPDMRQAYSMMALFFMPASKVAESMLGMKIDEHLIVNQVERAKILLDRRRHESNKRMPKDFWNEWDTIRKKGHLDDTFPTEWDMATRPLIAHCLYPSKSPVADY